MKLFVIVEISILNPRIRHVIRKASIRKQTQIPIVHTNKENVHINTCQNVIIEDHIEGNIVFYMMLTNI